ALSYDVAGQVSALTDVTGTHSYNYDDQGGLSADNSAAWEYDVNGNRINDANTPGDNNQLTTDGTWNYFYDAEGNVAKKIKISTGETWKYGYDHQNHLIS